MKALHFVEEDSSAVSYELLDLDGAFNDGFKRATGSFAPALGRWLFISWSIAAWGVGTYVIVRAILDDLPAVWADLPRWMF